MKIQTIKAVEIPFASRGQNVGVVSEIVVEARRLPAGEAIDIDVKSDIPSDELTIDPKVLEKTLNRYKSYCHRAYKQLMRSDRTKRFRVLQRTGHIYLVRDE